MSLFSTLFHRDGRMLFDYLAEKHNVSLPDLLTSPCLPLSFPCHLCEPTVVLGERNGRTETLDSFSGVCAACTNSADIYILWWIVKNKRSSSGLVDGAARMPELLYLPWCLASLLPHYCSPPTPVSRWPGCCPQCTSTQQTCGGPSACCGKGPAVQSAHLRERPYVSQRCSAAAGSKRDGLMKED